MSLRLYMVYCGVLWLMACDAGDNPVNFTKNELERLLASDSAKSWLLTARSLNNNYNLQSCEEDDVLTFGQEQSLNDSITIRLETGPQKCTGQTDDIVFQGTWDIIDRLTVDSLLLVINNDSLVRSIDLITSQHLILSYQQASDFIREEFVANQ